MSNLGICEICGRVVILTAFDVCHRCRGQRQKEVEAIFNHIKEHRGASINAIAEATGVNPALVLKLVQKGNLEVYRPAFGRACAKCGQLIQEGKYCENCGRGLKEKAKGGRKLR
jgi:rRNA maturation endonuclease Nob1